MKKSELLKALLKLSVNATAIINQINKIKKIDPVQARELKKGVIGHIKDNA